MDIRIKRAYEKPSRDDGRRVLVDRLWPRGVVKDKAKIDEWTKELAPSTELRKWFAHEPAKWAEFRKRYTREIHQHEEELAKLAAMAETGTVTLVFAAKDQRHNNAEVLKEVLQKELCTLPSATFTDP
jgi:uncharacterized protein YeaO (DUF488 family)